MRRERPDSELPFTCLASCAAIAFGVQEEVRMLIAFVLLSLPVVTASLFNIEKSELACYVS
jgi:hypothetical protein